MERACSDGLIAICFEPIADLARADVVGYRARPRFPLAVADQVAWFTAAARHGCGPQLTAATLTAGLGACDQLGANSFLILEVSGADLLSPEVTAVLSQAGRLEGVVLELTSLGANGDHHQLLRALAPVRRQGASLAVRATGGGGVGLLELIELAPDFVLVDRELIAYIDQRPRHAAAVAAIGGLAGELDAWLLADGVRRHEELEILAQLQVPLARGPLIGEDWARPGDLDVTARADLLRLASLDDRLGSLSVWVAEVSEAPDRVREVTVRVDERRRPVEVFVPGPYRRTGAPAMCVQRHDGVAEVARRATSRPVDQQLVPLCLIDGPGHLVGVIRIEALLRALAGVR